MRFSRLVSKTSKTLPSDETAVNAQLLIKAGYIHKEMAGVYAFLPLGLMVLEKIKLIVRQEMNRVDGQELLMSTLQPKDIWLKTDRWDDKKVDNWFKTKLANGTELGVGLTHEEPIVDALGEFIKSYKDLPVIVYQIQNKFRNELRAKSGLLRGREFLMKDMYSFARDQKEHELIYNKILEGYFAVYKRLGLGDITYRTYADGSIFTNRFSDEFQTISEVGEDSIYLDQVKRVAINQEIYTPENLKKLKLNPSDLVKVKAIEVGNTFHLESKYTDALDVFYTDQDGHRQSIIMGCYGIGISRLVGVIAEHFSDDRGLNWPVAIAPFKAYLTFIKSDSKIVKLADEIYQDLTLLGIEVIYDDRNVRPADKFADADLLGIPFRIVVNDRTVKDQLYEFKPRMDLELQYLSKTELIGILK